MTTRKDAAKSIDIDLHRSVPIPLMITPSSYILRGYSVILLGIGIIYVASC